MTYIEQQARKENRSFYRSSCGRIVQRVPGQDEFGDPQVTEHYMPVEAAIAMHEELGTALFSERSKPSLMVGFSGEEIERLVLMADSQAFRRDDGELMMSGFGNGYFAGLRLANTRAVSIDKIMEVVREATWINDVDLLRERLMKMTP